MMLVTYILATLLYLLIGSALARYINVQPTYAEFKDKPGHLGFIALTWPVTLFLAFVCLLVPAAIILFGKFILGQRAPSK